MRPSNPNGRRPSRPVRRLSTSSSLMPRASCFTMPTWSMPSRFNIARLSIYGLVLLWTLVCLIIAIHFQSILETSDLTHFVPFAIFVSSASMLVILVLLGSTLFKDRSPVSTRIELSGLAVLGVLWLALGVFLAMSESAEADVECFVSTGLGAEDIEATSGGFSSDTYHAQYHVLEAFSLFNTILVWGFLLFLLFLALRQHRMGVNKVWLYPVPTYPWFQNGAQAVKFGKSSRLPAPVTHSRSRGGGGGGSQKKSQKPFSAEPSFWVWVDKPKSPPAAHTRDRRRDQPRRSDSTRKY